MPRILSGAGIGLLLQHRILLSFQRRDGRGLQPESGCHIRGIAQQVRAQADQGEVLHLETAIFDMRHFAAGFVILVR